MQAKTTRAFRTISEAGEELDLQPHVLRFWESKFSQIKPIKRGGGRRFYRPEDIEFLRGIKILLHDEGHPIKDVQKLIRLKGPARVMELGQSVEKAATEKKVEDTILVPKRIKKTTAKSKPAKSDVTMSAPVSEPEKAVSSPPPVSTPVSVNPPPRVDEQRIRYDQPADSQGSEPSGDYVVKQLDTAPKPTPAEILQQRQDLEEALVRLKALKTRWSDFKAKLS